MLSTVLQWVVHYFRISFPQQNIFMISEWLIRLLTVRIYSCYIRNDSTSGKHLTTSWPYLMYSCSRVCILKWILCYKSCSFHFSFIIQLTMILCLRINMRSSERSILNLTNLVPKNEVTPHLQDIWEMIKTRYKPNAFPFGLSYCWYEFPREQRSETGNKGHIILRLTQYLSKFPSFS